MSKYTQAGAKLAAGLGTVDLSPVTDSLVALGAKVDAIDTGDFTALSAAVAEVAAVTQQHSQNFDDFAEAIVAG